MGHLFYIYCLITTIFLIATLSKFFLIKNVQEWYEKFEKITGKKPLKSDFRSEEEYNTYTSISIISVLELILLVGGLLTSNWYVYITLFVFSILLTLILKPIKFSILARILFLTNSLVRVTFYIFLIINHFHLHLDLYKMFIK